MIHGTSDRDPPHWEKKPNGHHSDQKCGKLFCFLRMISWYSNLVLADLSPVPPLPGACFKFPCGRWLGRSIDDGSLERYLVGSPVPGVPGPDQLRELVRDCAGPPAATSPPLPLRSTGTYAFNMQCCGLDPDPIDKYWRPKILRTKELEFFSQKSGLKPYQMFNWTQKTCSPAIMCMTFFNFCWHVSIRSSLLQYQ